MHGFRHKPYNKFKPESRFNFLLSNQSTTNKKEQEVLASLGRLRHVFNVTFGRWCLSNEMQ